MSESEEYRAVQLVSREMVSACGADFVQYIADNIIRELSEKVLDRAKFSDVIVSLKPMRITEQPSWNQLEYRRNMTVADLVRCKDCRWHEREQPGMVYCPATVGGWVEEDWFCKGGERKDDE